MGKGNHCGGYTHGYGESLWGIHTWVWGIIVGDTHMGMGNHCGGYTHGYGESLWGIHTWVWGIIVGDTHMGMGNPCGGYTHGYRGSCWGHTHGWVWRETSVYMCVGGGHTQRYGEPCGDT